MCYVHADWLNMMVNENIFNNTGLGCQPKYSWINPKNDRERKGYSVPRTRVCSSKSVECKDSVPPKGFSAVRPTRVWLLWYYTCDEDSLLGASQKRPDFCLVGLFVWVVLGFFTLTNDSMEIKAWNAGGLKHLLQSWGSPAQPQPLPWGGQSHWFQFHISFLWYLRSSCAEPSYNKRQLVQLNPLSSWIKVLVELLGKPVY